MATNSGRKSRRMVLRCSNDAGAGTDTSAGCDHLSPACCSNDKTASTRMMESRRIPKITNPIDDVKDGIAEVRQKLVLDLKNAADKLKNAIFMNEEAEEDEQKQKLESPPKVTAAAVVEGVRSLNLQKSAGDGEKGLKINDKKPNDSSQARKPKLRSDSEKMQREKFSVDLSFKEIEEDYMIMLGRRPPRRHKKRPKVVQKQLDTLFPGLSLREVTPDLYKVPKTRNAMARKGKEKGLKFFDSVEVD